ncbi:MAG: caspase family protein, partial [Hyphomicrobiales bacterium]|nr:caspase family protein [Hyphomicrobiales bacterium]
FTFAGNTIVSGGGSGWLRQYDRAGRLLGDYSGHTSDVWAVSASRNGKYLVSGSDDQTLRLWNRISRENIVSLFHASDGQWVMWTPQGYFNASPDGDEFIGWHVNKGPDKAAVFVTAARLKKHFYRPYIVDEAIRLASARDAVSRAENTSFSFNELADKSPPSFKIIRVTPKIEASAIRLELSLSLAASSQAPERLGVIVNGRNTFSSADGLPGAGGGDVTIEIAGAPGRNLIEINLDNPVGITTQRIAVRAPDVAEPRRNRLFVLAIGVDDYTEFNQDLSFAAADAKAILSAAKKFAGRLHQTVIGTLVADGERIAPTAANITTALKLLAQVRSDDTVIVFLAGHGINDGADYLFLPRDARQSGGRWDPKTVINWRKLQDALAATKGRRVMVIDTCHAGNAFNPRLIKDADDANITILAATDADTLAEERAALGHGVFTHALLKGLGGAADAGSDGEVEVGELGRFIKQSVRGLTDGKQSPVAHLPVSGDFTVAKY